MTKVDIYSGFLGAGKTTLIKKLLSEVYSGQKVVIIENEFGQIGIDGGFLKETGIQVTEMNSGCICCSLVGDFGKALGEVIEKYSPDRIIIEPSGVGKLSDVIAAVKKCDNTEIFGTTAVIDASKCKIYLKNFKEFYENQIKSAATIVLSRTGNIKQEKLDEAVSLIRAINPEAEIITTPWDQLDGAKIYEAISHPSTAASHAAALAAEMLAEHGHEHHEHEHHEHEHHDHEHHDHEHHDHEHHEHGEGCTCGCHDNHHEGHHHADDVFDSIGFETSKKFTTEKIKAALEALDDNSKYGTILRSKGIVSSDNGEWIHFDYVPGESNVRTGSAETTGLLCVIGSGVNKDAIKELFEI